MNIPVQLQKPEFRFYRIQTNGKLPIDKAWNRKNNWHYDHSMINYHNGNIGVACGYGDLIVIDFDDAEYHNKVKAKLPKTFRVITATKRLPHYYYYLKGAKDLKKKAITNDEGRTMCDIQAQGAGVVAPNSCINGRYYEPDNNEITEITLEQLKEIFELDKFKKYSEFKGEDLDPQKESENKRLAFAVLYITGVKLNKYRNMKCPFHEMNGAGNLSITSYGKIHCFHCDTSLWADQYLVKFYDTSYRKANKMLDVIRAIYNLKKR